MKMLCFYSLIGMLSIAVAGCSRKQSTPVTFIGVYADCPHFRQDDVAQEKLIEQLMWAFKNEDSLTAKQLLTSNCCCCENFSNAFDTMSCLFSHLPEEFISEKPVVFEAMSTCGGQYSYVTSYKKNAFPYLHFSSVVSIVLAHKKTGGNAILDCGLEVFYPSGKEQWISFHRSITFPPKPAHEP